MQNSSKSKLLLCSRIFYFLWFLLVCLGAYYTLPSLLSDIRYPGELQFLFALILFFMGMVLILTGLFFTKRNLLVVIGSGLHVLFYLIGLFITENGSFLAALPMFILLFLYLLPNLSGMLFLLGKKKARGHFICTAVMSGLPSLLDYLLVFLAVYAFFEAKLGEDIEGNVVLLCLLLGFTGLCQLLQRLGLLFYMAEALKHKDKTLVQKEQKA